MIAKYLNKNTSQDVNISPFVNHFILKNPRALDTFLHVNQMKMYIYVVVKFLIQVIFVFLLFFGMVMYANEVETKEK